MFPSPVVTFLPASFPIKTLQHPLVILQPASLPIATLPSLVVTPFPIAIQPIAILSAPLVTFIPAHSPKNVLKQPLLPSKSSPAQVPASKFLSASGVNPPKELPSALAKFVAVITPLTQASPATLNLELGFVVPIPTLKSEVPEIHLFAPTPIAS